MDVVGGGTEGCWRRSSAARQPGVYAPDFEVQEGSKSGVGGTIGSGMTLFLGILLIVAGGVWAAQGLNMPWAPGSFMTADPAWVVIGAATLLAGLVLVVRAVRRRAGPDRLD